MSKSCVIALTLLCLLLARAPAQERNETSGKHFTILPIQLLPGYKVEGRPGGIDTASARFFKDDGFSFQFSLGVHLENRANSIGNDQIEWREKQTINGRHLTCVYTKSGELVASFGDLPVTNFSAKIHTQQELAEMLLMVLTFEPQHGYPIDPSAVVPPQAKPK